MGHTLDSSDSDSDPLEETKIGIEKEVKDEDPFYWPMK